MQKLYIVTRSDLPAGMQLAQTSPALQAFNDQHRTVASTWEGNLVVLAVAAGARRTDASAQPLAARARSLL